MPTFRYLIMLALLACSLRAVLAAEPAQHADEPKSTAGKAAAASFLKKMAEIDAEAALRRQAWRERYCDDLDAARKGCARERRPGRTERLLALKKAVQAENHERRGRGQPPEKSFVVHQAIYGDDAVWGDVTENVRRQVNNGRLVVFNTSQADSTVRSFPDTFPGRGKHLVIAYSVNGRVQIAVVAEGERTTLPANPQ